MDRRLRFLAVLAAAATAPGAIPEARADRLGGNYRGPGDTCRIREDRPPDADAPRHPVLDAFDLDARFVAGSDAALREGKFRGRPVLLFLALPGCAVSASVAGGALRDPEVAALAARFALAVADAEKEESFGLSRGVRTIPTILILDGEGRETGRVEGAVDGARLAGLLRDVLRVAGPACPTPEAAALEREASLLARARRAREWRAALAAAAAIERIGHDGPERRAAREARDAAGREAAALLETARARIEAGSPTAGRRILERIAREFEGVEEAVEATALLGSRSRGGSAPSGLRGSFQPVPRTNPRPETPRVPVPVPAPETPTVPQPEPEPEPDP